MIKKIWFWFARSSADPKKTALTLSAGVPAVIWFLSMSSVGVDMDVNAFKDLLNEGVSALAEFLAAIVQVGLTGAALFGVARKIWITISALFAKKDQA